MVEYFNVKSVASFECGPHPPISTLCPTVTIQTMNVPRPSLLFHFHAFYWMLTEEPKNLGGLGVRTHTIMGLVVIVNSSTFVLQDPPHKEEYNIARFTPFYCCIHCVANCLCTVFFLLFSPECCMPLWTTVVLLGNVQAHTSLWRTLSVALWGEMATRFVE